MKRHLAQQLYNEAIERAIKFTEQSPEKGYPDMIWDLSHIKPLSETTAGVYFNKTDRENGEQSWGFLFYMYFPNSRKWHWIPPSHDHTIGMEKLRDCLQEVEEHNWELKVKV